MTALLSYDLLKGISNGRGIVRLSQGKDRAIKSLKRYIETVGGNIPRGQARGILCYAWSGGPGGTSRTARRSRLQSS